MKICIFMPTTIIIDTSSKLSKQNMLEINEKRLKQYQNGIKKVLDLNKKHNFDIYIADNGYNFNGKIQIPEGINIIMNNPNKYGKFNKGACIH